MHAQTPQKSGAETEKREEPNPLLSWWSSIVLVPLYLLAACLFYNFAHAQIFHIPVFESLVRPFPLDRLMLTAAGVYVVDVVRILILRKSKKHFEETIHLIMAGTFILWMVASYPLFLSNRPSPAERARYNAEHAQYENAKSCSDIDGIWDTTVYENGRCYWKKDIKYVDQSLKILETKDGIVRRNNYGEYVKGIEVTVDTGVFDGKEYKKGDTIFFEQGSSKLDKYRVAEINGTKYLVTINPHTYKWDVENKDTGNKLPPVLEIDGKKYDKTTEADRWETLSENTRYRDTVEAYVRSE